MENLKNARLRMGLSQQKLAEMIGFSQQTIYQYEHGITQPDLSTLKKLADCLHTTTDYLVGYSEIVQYETDDGISADELALLNHYRSLSDPGRNLVRLLLEELMKKEK